MFHVAQNPLILICLKPYQILLSVSHLTLLLSANEFTTNFA